MKTFSILLTLGFSLIVSTPAGTAAPAERGQAPQCQEQCVANHVKAMQKLSAELVKTRKILAYQDLVEVEVSNYSECITNCRLIYPIK
jgi:hypothetical protein